MNMIQGVQQWLDDRLGLTQSDVYVAHIKENAQNKVDEMTEVLKEQSELQRLVIKKTTTYYIGKAAGVIK